MKILERAGADDLGKEEHRTAPLAAEIRHIEIAQLGVEDLTLHVDDGQIELHPPGRNVEPGAVSLPCRPALDSRNASVEQLSATGRPRPDEDDVRRGRTGAPGFPAEHHPRLSRRI